MKLLCFLFISVVLSTTGKAQSKSITFGAGPSTSLWYWNGGPLQTWGTANFNNTTTSRKNVGMSFSLQYNKEFKQGFDYFFSLSYDSYGIKFKNTFRRDNFLIEADTREKYKTVFFSAGLEKKMKINKVEINAAIGLYSFYYNFQQIELAPFIDQNGLNVIFKTSITNRWDIEAGIQGGLRLLYPINKGMKIGINPIYYYTISTLGAEKISANIIYSVAL